jgi:glutamyl-tRNA synthetase
MVRVRFAPSPTGYLHVGGARTALFNWLFARRSGGTFVLRIEDTDAERSSDDMVEGILQSMRWLGLDWDEGPGIGGPHAPYFQSQRFDRHRAAAERLVAQGSAYLDFTTPEEYERDRAEAAARGDTWRYERARYALPRGRAAELSSSGAPRAIRFRVPEGETTFTDLVHGPITIDHANVEDFVLLRRDGLPTYQLSVVCDDIDMAITHVVRGDDHISNTPKQILLYRALGATLPAFAHVPLILGPDKKRLSKRHGATAVTEYETQGYLPEAMVNFLALLGWSPGDDRELFSRADLLQAFTLEGIGTSNAVFNPEKLEWMNSQHIMQMPTEELARRLEPLFRKAGLWDESFAGDRREWLLRVLDLFKPRAKRLHEFVDRSRFFFAPAVQYDAKAVKKHLHVDPMPEHLDAIGATLANLPSFDAEVIESAVRDVAGTRGVRAPALMQAIRVAVTGDAASPGLFDVLELLGRSKTLERLAEASKVARAGAQ